MKIFSVIFQNKYILKHQRICGRIGKNGNKMARAKERITDTGEMPCPSGEHV